MSALLRQLHCRSRYFVPIERVGEGPEIAGDVAAQLLRGVTDHMRRHGEFSWPRAIKTRFFLPMCAGDGKKALLHCIVSVFRTFVRIAASNNPVGTRWGTEWPFLLDAGAFCALASSVLCDRPPHPHH
jgi:hypothetical protein